MKKVIIIVTLSALVFIFSLLSLNVNINAEVETILSINDFETIEDAYALTYLNRFGVASINHEKEYISSGEGSLKLELIGKESASPRILIPFDKHSKEYDISRLTSIELDIFSTLTEESKICYALQINNEETTFYNLIVKPGKNSYVLELNVQGLSVAYDIKKGNGLIISFPLSYGLEIRPVYYIDNVKGNMSPFGVNPYYLNSKDNEFCDFDDDFEEFVVLNTCGVACPDEFKPELTLNRDPLFCSDRSDPNFVYGINKSLKVKMIGGMDVSGFPGFSFIDKLWHQFEYSEMDDTLFVFDVYNDSNADFSFSFSVWRNPDNYYTGFYDRYSISFIAKAYEWTTIKLSIKEWNDAANETGGGPLSSSIVYGKVVYNYQRPFIYYSGSNVGDNDRYVYFDNFRFEKIIQESND